MAFVQAGGLTVHCELAGPAGAPVLLFANSLGTDFRIWDPVVAALGGRFRTLRYDMRGHGLTDCPPVAGDRGYSIDELAADALALMDAVGVEAAHVCGLSIGGMVAQKLTALAPGRVRSVVLCDTASRIGTPEMWADRVAAIRAGGLAAVVDGVMQRWFTPEFGRTRPADLAGYRAMLLRTPVDGYVGCCLAIRDADLGADAAAIRCPALVVVGDQDGSTPPDLVEGLARAIPGARFEVIAGAGHIPNVERTATLVALLDGFLPAAESQDTLLAQGFETRRAVLGAAHVERASRRATAFDQDFQHLITRFAWGMIWPRPGLDRVTRSLLTIAMLASLGHEEELKLHIRATRNTGATAEQVKEVLMQVAVYAGVPAANTAFRLAKEAYEELAKEPS